MWKQTQHTAPIDFTSIEHIIRSRIEESKNIFNRTLITISFPKHSTRNWTVFSRLGLQQWTWTIYLLIIILFSLQHFWPPPEPMNTLEINKETISETDQPNLFSTPFYTANLLAKIQLNTFCFIQSFSNKIPGLNLSMFIFQCVIKINVIIE